MGHSQISGEQKNWISDIYCYISIYALNNKHVIKFNNPLYNTRHENEATLK